MNRSSPTFRRLEATKRTRTRRPTSLRVYHDLDLGTARGHLHRSMQDAASAAAQACRTTGVLNFHGRRVWAGCIPYVLSGQPTSVAQRSSLTWLEKLAAQHLSGTELPAWRMDLQRSSLIKAIIEQAPVQFPKRPVSDEEYGFRDQEGNPFAPIEWYNREPQELEPTAWVWPRLGLPIPAPISGFRTVDLVITRRSGPAIVIQVDAENRDYSQQNLLFAAQAGAEAVWIRWGNGPVLRPPGVIVIDRVGH